MEQSISFEQMPGVVAEICTRLEVIESILQEFANLPDQVEDDKLMGVKEAAEFLGLSVQTVYGKVSKGLLPNMKRSKKLYFSKKDLVAYLNRGRRKTNLEIEEEANKRIAR